MYRVLAIVKIRSKN